MTTPDLLQELKTTKSSYKKEKIPVILLERYDSMKDEERKQVFKILLRKGVVDNNVINRINYEAICNYLYWTK